MTTARSDDTDPNPQGVDNIGLSRVGTQGDDCLDAIARAETARIYSRTVPEYHGNARALPGIVTEWERARLARAARNLAVTKQPKETA